MDGFQTFNTGNLKKFLQQTKKNKEPLYYKSISSQNEKHVIKIQTKIRTFLSLNNKLMRESGILWLSELVDNHSTYELCNNL
jgi:hypothetical protein